MKRASYRKAKAELAKEKERAKKKGQALFDTHYQQETTIYATDDRKRDREAVDSKTREIDLDTNEIFYDRERKRQWFWSDSQHGAYRILALGLVVVTLVLLWFIGPFVISYLRGLFHQAQLWF
ncbi:hypothetical protein ACX3VT_06065 [Aerococcus sanguinicola]|uniref:hypothetical protein n=1 Tax=unclassified Aerococcus TaxID=2618060 RepID=UPI0008A3DDCB|nr:MULTISPECIES: hypothetical protein [unclassified Aerococcus]KAB0647920.1 hypothetical protein F6I01_00305 [Aerococcus sanguinicola]MDK6233415.1 hypothetical protein [Aerococcus sp. UMB10185]MDK6855602.1 hypothetical protein [Aerococcus sp. UMB7533]MDK8502321.1 hypothetical protein [Aerococcus sp. UMB1112A]OFN02331.1 hypothetical protein HMPREF2626_06785 [Aerococcus sp. HMSC062A02]